MTSMAKMNQFVVRGLILPQWRGAIPRYRLPPRGTTCSPSTDAGIAPRRNQPETTTKKKDRTTLDVCFQRARSASHDRNWPKRTQAPMFQGAHLARLFHCDSCVWFVSRNQPLGAISASVLPPHMLEVRLETDGVRGRSNGPSHNLLEHVTSPDTDIGLLSCPLWHDTYHARWGTRVHLTERELTL